MKIDVSPGELIDRLTILEIKMTRLADPGGRAHTARILEAALRLFEAEIVHDAVVERLRNALKEINLKLWLLEDELRDHERREDFGPSFVAAARGVYRTNDQRAAIKREIDAYLGSEFADLKSYSPY